MLPFLKKQKQMAGVSMEYRKPDQKPEQNQEQDGLEMCAQDMLSAHASADKKALASALRAAFAILESEPHHEGPHTEEDSE